MTERLQLEYYCASFNAICAVVMKTQSAEKFYHVFIFKENAARNELVWERIVDMQAEYRFDVELNQTFARARIAEARPHVPGMESGDRRGAAAVRFLSSQYLADSSLSQSVHLFGGKVDAASDAAAPNQEGPLMTSKLTRQLMGLEGTLEMDVFNRNPSMIMLLRVIERLHREVSPPSAQLGEMPPWMKEFHSKMNNRETPINIRMFIGKVVINRAHVFEPYSAHWWRPLAMMTIDAARFGPGIHYVIQDFCAVLIAWSTPAAAPSEGGAAEAGAQAERTYPPIVPKSQYEDQILASDLIRFLMSNCHHPKKAILRNNLEIIKCLVENWREALVISTRVLYEQLGIATTRESSDNLGGIQLVAVVLQNRLVPYQRQTAGDISEAAFVSRLLDNMAYKSRDIYASAAEVAGMLVSFLDTAIGAAEEPSTKQALADLRDIGLDLLRKRIESMSQLQNGPLERDIFLNCLHKVSLHYPELVDAYIKQIIFYMPQYHGDFKVMCLDVLESRAEHVDQIFVVLKSQDLLGLISHRDEGVQLKTLQLIYRILKLLSVDDIAYFLPTLAHSCASIGSLPIRLLYFDVIIWIYDNAQIEPSSALHQQLCTELLKGLADEAQIIRVKMTAFWNAERRLSSDTGTRVVSLMNVAYTSEVEDIFLNYASWLLLEATKKRCVL
mgnify:CR=1 FL=1